MDMTVLVAPIVLTAALAWAAYRKNQLALAFEK